MKLWSNGIFILTFVTYEYLRAKMRDIFDNLDIIRNNVLEAKPANCGWAFGLKGIGRGQRSRPYSGRPSGTDLSAIVILKNQNQFIYYFIANTHPTCCF